LELELDHRELRCADLDRRHPVVAEQPLSFPLGEQDGTGGRPAAAGLDVDAVEPAGLAAVPRPQVLGEAAVRRVEVEEPRRRRRPEAVDDLDRRTDAPTWRENVLLVVDQDGESALEDVERIGVVMVDVWARAVPRAVEVRLGDRELVEARLEHDPAAEERLSFAWSEHDTSHRSRVCR
jgi:hypothetical protein